MLYNEAGAHINSGCEETVCKTRKPERKIECHTVEEENGCGPNAGRGDKKCCNDLNIMYPSLSSTKFIYTKPQNIDIDNER